MGRPRTGTIENSGMGGGRSPPTGGAAPTSTARSVMMLLSRASEATGRR